MNDGQFRGFIPYFAQNHSKWGIQLAMGRPRCCTKPANSRWRRTATGCEEQRKRSGKGGKRPGLLASRFARHHFGASGKFTNTFVTTDHCDGSSKSSLHVHFHLQWQLFFPTGNLRYSGVGLDAPVAGKGGMSYKEKQEAELAAKEGPKVHMSCRGHGFPWSTGNFIWQWTILIQRWISSE